MGSLSEVFGRPFSRNGVAFAGRTDRAITTDLMTANGVHSSEVERGLGNVFKVMPRIMEMEAAKTPSILYPGVAQLLEALGEREDTLLGLVTGNMESTAFIKLASAGIDTSQFQLGAYGDESADRNALPPKALRRAAALCRRSISKTVVVGDTPKDIHCAQVNGLRAMAVATGPFTVEELAIHRPDHVFPDLSDLPAVMQALNF
jgi:phosphoglycolate phosphatase-like HAD superfamily hydrolase